MRHLHSHNLIHADIKPRNIMRHGSATEGVIFKLIDMDAAAIIGERAGLKISSAYCPPELARKVLWAAERTHLTQRRLKQIRHSMCSVWARCYSRPVAARRSSLPTAPTITWSRTAPRSS